MAAISYIEVDNLPDDNSKNPTASVVCWFYMHRYGRKPDQSIYGRHMSKKNPKSLYHLLVENPEYPVEVYKPSEIGRMILYLENNGVKVDDISIATLPGLMFAFENDNQAELQRIVTYLKGDKVDYRKPQEKEFTAPEGW